MNDFLFWAEIWVKIAFAVFLFLAGAMFINRGMTAEDSNEQKYFRLGIAMMAIMIGLTRIFFVAVGFYVEGTVLREIFWKSAAATTFIGLTFIALVIETYLVKSRYIFSAIGVIGAVVICFVSLELASTLLIYFFLIIGFEIVVLYLYIAIKSPGALRKKALLIIISLFLFSLGILLDRPAFDALLGFDGGIIATIIMWVGLGSYLKLVYN